MAFLFLILTFNAGAQERTYPPATQAEVNAGIIHNKFVAPDTLAGWTGGGGGGGSTNGLTQPQVKSLLESGTNNFRGTNINVTQVNTGGITVTNGMTNLSATASTAAGFDVNKKLVSLANVVGVLAWSGSGSPAFVLAPVLDGASISNVNAGAVTAGANITLTKTKNSTTGITNTAVALSDPMSENQGNFGNITVTNFYVSTNDMTGVTVVDFATGSVATYDGLASGLTITGFQNAVAGVENEKIIKVHASGNQTVGWPASWRLAPTVTGTATNADWTYYWVDMQSGHYTNVLEIYVH